MERAAVDTLLGLHSRVALNACQAPSPWPGEALDAKHGVHEGSALSARETLCWGYTHGMHRRFAKSCSHGPAKRSLRSMGPTMALH